MAENVIQKKKKMNILTVLKFQTFVVKRRNSKREVMK
jgi:hypothetical protein